jgi:quercetin dioxygenase-like cupin family protein
MKSGATRLASFAVAAALAALSAGPLAAHGGEAAHGGHAGTPAKSAGAVIPRFAQPLPNVPGKSMIAVEVTLAPGEHAAPHRHAASAFIMAYVLSGNIRNQVAGEPARDYGPGDTWKEDPGAHHVMAVNLSKTKEAKLLAVFVVDSTETELTTIDK